ncbi:MAG: hypothetical protein D3923_19695, partial [Candidatus Electrothrix sp. AR3]|nr:hypothetical protein [Candidatus Electrothrix sp. AR3]
MNNFPCVLIVASGRINGVDNANNGLLLRNLFAQWPRENLAQIYNISENEVYDMGENDDLGFFGNYYKLSSRDRFMGSLFYKIKAKELGILQDQAEFTDDSKKKKGSLIKSTGKKILFDTRLYEFIFRPRLSQELKQWIRHFQPDIVFAQGYSYAFTLLPLLISNFFRLPLVYYPTDDWPNEQYRITNYSDSFISRFVG